MSGHTLLIQDAPKELVDWLKAEASRCGQTVEELVIHILESYRFWNCRNDDQNEVQSINETEEQRAAESKRIGEAIKKSFGG